MASKEQLFKKACDYKEKYLKVAYEKRNSLFRDSYLEKAKKYLNEAKEAGLIEAHYAYAVYGSHSYQFTYSNNINLNAKNPFSNNGSNDWGRSLAIAANAGHKDAVFYYARLLIKHHINDSLTLDPVEYRKSWAIKACECGREDGYIVLLEFYQAENMKKEFFEVLEKYKPTSEFDLLKWPHVYEYLQGLKQYKSKEEYRNFLQFLVSNLEIYLSQYDAYHKVEKAYKVLSELGMIYYKNKEYASAYACFMKMRNDHYEGYLHASLVLLKTVVNVEGGIKDVDFYELVKGELLKEFKTQYLPTIQEVNKNSYYTPYLLLIVGYYLLEGKIVPKDETLGSFYIEKARERGANYYTEINLLLAYYYMTKGIKYDEALKIYQYEIQYNGGASKVDTETLALCYYKNEMHKEARELYESLLETKYKNVPPPSNLLKSLAWMYRFGRGAKMDLNKAAEYLEIHRQYYKDVFVLEDLGDYYYKLKKYDQMYKVYLDGYSFSKWNVIEERLGFCFENGFGVEKDIKKAKEFYEKSASKENSAAKRGLNRLKKQEENVIVVSLDDKQQKELEEASKNLQDAANELKNVLDNGGLEKLKQVLKKEEPNLKEVDTSKAKKELESLIGLQEVKEQVQRLERLLQFNTLRKSKGLATNDVSKHMVFTGNPGTGKTTVARIIAQIFKENGILSKGQLIETDRGGLVGQYIGETAQKTAKIINEAIGGVLFIDEAYSLVPEDGGKDFGLEAIATLLKMMEDHKEDLVVIVAGYKEEMKHFIDANPGLKSRFTTYIDFVDYNVDELYAIFEIYAKKGQYVIQEEAKNKLMILFSDLVTYENFGNGRACRNVYEKSVLNLSDRVIGSGLMDENSIITITADDIPNVEDVLGTEVK